MSGNFVGFSEEDIRNLNDKSTAMVAKLPPDAKIGFQEKRPSNRVQKHTTDFNKKILQDRKKDSVAEPIPEGAKLSPQTNNSSNISQAEPTDDTSNCDTNKQTVEGRKEDLVVEALSKKPIETAIETDVPERKLDLVQFQERQKLIEEQNKKRKELLAKALAVRTQQTKEEAQKLEAIRQEFKKLDILLSGDVKILRQQIEVASLEYMEAEKRYFRIEKEFLNAKILLHQKSERKEMLTEHLCAVIEKNEERKAEKLNELMNKLNLKTDFQDEDKSSSIKNPNC